MSESILSMLKSSLVKLNLCSLWCLHIRDLRPDQSTLDPEVQFHLICANTLRN